MLDQLIGAQEFEFSLSRDPISLLAAEILIIETCRELNEAAGLAAERRAPNLSLKLGILKSITSCEASALSAQALLESQTAILGSLLP
ncbi:MAG: hypothetical protein EXR86_06905 [Gammaproteobacteria bacterium]|nr:hypothetical protein [Gammaproteobacteria bacterium]